MRAEDLLRAKFELGQEFPDATVAEIMLAHGVAFDEMSRVFMVGGFFAEHDLRREGETEIETAGRVWLDGFLVGLRIGRAETPRNL